MKLHCPKSDLNFWQISALASKKNKKNNIITLIGVYLLLTIIKCLYFWPILEARAEICQKFRSLFEQWSFKKNCFWDLLTFIIIILILLFWYYFLNYNEVVRILFSLVVVVVVMAPLFPLPFPAADVFDVIRFTVLWRFSLIINAAWCTLKPKTLFNSVLNWSDMAQ